ADATLAAQEVRNDDCAAPDSHHDRAPPRRRHRRLDGQHIGRGFDCLADGGVRREAARGSAPPDRLRTCALHLPGGGRLRRRPRERLMPTADVPALRTRGAPRELVSTPLLPAGFGVPPSRWIHPATRFRELLQSEPYLFGPGVYDPMGAQL